MAAAGASIFGAFSLIFSGRRVRVFLFGRKNAVSLQSSRLYGCF
jgi:hypothetical protein